MLYQFLLNFVDTFGFLNVFKYLTFRTGLSFFTSLVIVLIIGGPFIKFFSKQKILAGGALNHKKPKQEPIIAPQKIATSPVPSM